MPILFISLDSNFIDKIKNLGYEAYCIKIQDFKIRRKTFYISPANSLLFMDGGIDYALSRIIFPNIEQYVKKILNKYGLTSLLGRKYLPIGSSLIINYDNNKSLCFSPTMLLPQDVSETNNAYYATVSALYNILINYNQNINNVDIIMTSLCCGYGKMSVENSINQIIKGIQEFKNYIPSQKISNQLIINEPNLNEQPKYYQNSEWFNIDPTNIIKIT